MSSAAPAVAPPRRGTWNAPVAIAASTVAIAVLLVGNRSLPVGVALTVVVVPFVAWLSVLRAEPHGPVVDVRVLVAAIGALLLLAVALAPTQSGDVWSYSMYGRMLAQHGVSPYTHVPRDFPHDPFLHLVSRGWRGTPSVYGPVFVGFAAIGSAVAGSSTLIARLFHEAGAAMAVAVALGLIWRRTHSPAALMLLGLNPLVIVSVVNGGHNDALVGLGVLIAVLLTEEERPAAAGVVLALAALIKVTALLALPALAVWMLYRFGPRPLRRFGGAALGTVALGYVLAGPSAITALGANRRLMSRASLWQLGRAAASLGPGHAGLGISHSAWLSAFGFASIALVGVLALVVAWRFRERELSSAVVLALSAYLVAGIYVLPWYVMWVLPVACLVRHRATLIWIGSFATFITAVYVVKDRALPGSVSTSWWWAGAYLGPVVLLGAYLLIVLRASSSRGPDPAPLPATRPAVDPVSIPL